MGTSANISYDILLKTTDHNKIDREFKKNIFDNIFFKNLGGLKNNSLEVLFNNNKWEQNPKQFCIDRYGESSFYSIILMVNNISSIFSFKRNNFKDFIIYAPPRKEMIKILSYSR